MGLPGAGKSRLAATLVDRGYARLNRDEAGGSLASLIPPLEHGIAQGGTRFVLDNTYLTRDGRMPVVEVAHRHGFAARCTWVTTSLEEAQVNAVWRLVSRYGRLPTPEDLRSLARDDPAAIGPGALFRCQRALEPPQASEGFSSIEAVAFRRERDPSLTARAVICWCDGVLSRSRSGRRAPCSADDVEVLPGRRAVLRRYEADGWRILGLAWRPEIAQGAARPDEVAAAFGQIRDLLGTDMEIAHCPHDAGPPVCWCRKPLPGLGVLLVLRHRLDPARTVYVGAGPQDRVFARRLGFTFAEAATFFRGGP
jgi:histidinol phosphatase-like enzyme